MQGPDRRRESALLFLPPTWFASVTQVLLGADTGPRRCDGGGAVLVTPVVGGGAALPGRRLRAPARGAG